MRTARRSEPPNMCARVGIGLLKERYADQVQCVARYKPSRDGNHHANKRNESKLNNDRSVGRIAFRSVHMNNDRCVNLIAFHSVHCRVSTRERKERRRPTGRHNPPRFDCAPNLVDCKPAFFLQNM